MSRISLISNINFFRERSRREFVDKLVAMGHHVSVVCPGDTGWVGRAAWPCVWQGWALSQHGTNPVGELAALRQLYRILRTTKPDIVLNFRLKPVLYGTIAAKLCGVKYIDSIFTGLGLYFIDDKHMNSPLGKILQMCLRATLRRNRTVFFQNPDDQALFERRGLVRHEQTCVLPGSGVNIEEFSPRAQTQTGTSFLLVTRLIREKGILEFCEAARSVRATHPDARFLICGAASTEPSAIGVTDLAPWTGDGTVEFLGELEDVRPAIADASAIVLPSYYSEGVPRSLLEGLAMGRPIITTDMPGCRMTVEEGHNGFLVPPRNAGALAEAMLKIVGNPELATAMGARSRSLAVERFDVHRIMADLAQKLTQDTETSSRQ